MQRDAYCSNVPVLPQLYIAWTPWLAFQALPYHFTTEQLWVVTSALSVAAAYMKGLNCLLLSGCRCRPGDQGVEHFMASYVHVSQIPLALRLILPSGQSIWTTGSEREGHARAELCNKIGDNIP